jgi:glycosyltransferase involved in cell wall biosynthesis
MSIEMEKLGWEVHLMGKTSSTAPFEGYEGFQGEATLIQRRGRLLTEINYHRTLWRLLLREDFDVVMFEPPQFRLIILPAILSWLKIIKSQFILDVRTPLVEDALTSNIDRFNYYFTMIFAKWFLHGVTVITKGLKKDLQALIGKNKPVAVWGSGVNPEIFDPSTAKSNLRYNLGLEERFIFFYHGTLTATRGIPELISAIIKLSVEYPGVALVLLGDGPSVRELKKIAHKSGSMDKVYFLGIVNNTDVPEYISIADVGVIPLPPERHWQVSSPLKLFEYMAMQLPIVVSDIEAHRDVLGEAPFAVYTKEVSTKELYETLKSCIVNISYLKNHAGLAREMVIDRHTWFKNAEVLSKFLISIDGVKSG